MASSSSALPARYTEIFEARLIVGTAADQDKARGVIKGKIDAMSFEVSDVAHEPFLVRY